MIPTIVKLFPSGALEVTDIINGRLVSHVYYYISKREALRLFREQYLRGQQ